VDAMRYAFTEKCWNKLHAFWVELNGQLHDSDAVLPMHELPTVI